MGIGDKGEARGALIHDREREISNHFGVGGNERRWALARPLIRFAARGQVRYLWLHARR